YHVPRDGRRHRPCIRKGKILSDNAAPPVGAKPNRTHRQKVYASRATVQTSSRHTAETIWLNVSYFAAKVVHLESSNGPGHHLHERVTIMLGPCITKVNASIGQTRLVTSRLI